MGYITLWVFLISGVQIAGASHHLGEHWQGGMLVWMSDQTAAGTGGATGAHYLIMNCDSGSVGDWTAKTWADAMAIPASYTGHGLGWHVPSGFPAGNELEKLCTFAKQHGYPCELTHNARYWSSTPKTATYSYSTDFDLSCNRGFYSNTQKNRVRLVNTGTF